MKRKTTDNKQEVLKIVRSKRMILQSDITKIMNKSVNYSIDALVKEGKINRQKVKNRGRVGNLTDVWLIYLNSVKQNEILDYERQLINKPFKSPLEGNTYKKDLKAKKDNETRKVITEATFEPVRKLEAIFNSMNPKTLIIENKVENNITNSMELDVIDSKVIPIYNDNNERVVNARELHSYLQVGKDFSTWIKDRINKYGFVEPLEYRVFTKIGENLQGGRPQKEYYLTMDTAKEIAMVENNERGRYIRKYFIETEKQFKTQNLEQPTNNIEALKMVVGVLEQHENRIDSIENKLKSLAQ